MQCQPTTPDYVIGKISVEFPIEEVHKAILYNFDFYSDGDSLSVEKIIKRLLSEIKKFKSSNCVERIRRVPHLQKLINAFQNGGKERYLSLVIPILDVYREKRDQRPISLVEIVKQKGNIENQEEMLDIISQFLDIAEDYIILNIFPEEKIKAACPACNKPVEDLEQANENGIQLCSCGYRKITFSGINVSGGNLTSNSAYENRENFRKGMARKQGKMHSKIPDELIDRLDEYFSKKFDLSRKKVLSQKCDSDGVKPNTSLRMLRNALSDLEYSSLFNDIDYIAHIFWGWSLLDFSHLEEEMMNVYDDTQKVYDETPDKERAASLNLQWRMFHQLRGLNFFVSEDRFLFQESDKSLQFHREMWKKMCEESGRPYYCLY